MNTSTATQIQPKFRVSAETHATSMETETREDAEYVLSVVTKTMGNHDWKLTPIN